VVKATSDSHGSVFDTIRDFQRGSDHIDLRSIDANSTAAGNQAFTFLSKSAFHGKAGELRYAGGVLSGDVNGDKAADFKVHVTSLAALSKADFYL